jgi:hypothetical protein
MGVGRLFFVLIAPINTEGEDRRLYVLISAKGMLIDNKAEES